MESIYSSVLTANSQTYSRTCGKSNYYYQTIRIQIQKTGRYSFGGLSTMNTYGYIYNNSFHPYNPNENKLSENGSRCDDYQFQILIDLQINSTYILVITTLNSNEKGNFSVHATGLGNVTFDHISEVFFKFSNCLFLFSLVESYSTCSIGDWCHFYTKTIGLTLDDILREEIRSDRNFNNQSFLVKTSAALTIIMFIGGLINSIFSLLTFQNNELRKIGCGVYLLASSVTSLLTIFMFIIKYCFVLITQMNLLMNLTIFRVGCMSIEPLLKLFIYLDTWLNACVSIERTIAVSTGIKFNKIKSKKFARWIIIILPFGIMGTLIHEPIHRDLFEYYTETYKLIESEVWTNKSEEFDKITNHSEISTNESWKYEQQKHIWCITRYSISIQYYNTFILFFHLTVPFIINLFSALFIIFGVARQRSVTQN